MVEIPPIAAPNVRLLTGAALIDALPRLIAYTQRGDASHPAHHPYWLFALKEGLGHVPYALEAVHAGKTVGYLPLSFVRSTLFGRFLVSLPYLNTGGVHADDDDTSIALVHRAAELAGELSVRHLELRHERTIAQSGAQRRSGRTRST